MNNLDAKDKKIIALLDMNARIPANELAKKARIGREVVEYRLKRLEKLKIISKTHTVFDIDLLGYRSFRILLRLFQLTQEERNKFIEYLVAHNNSWWVASIGGKWDVIANFVAEDASHFNDIFEEIITKYGDYLQGYEVLTYIDIHDFPRNYLSEKNNGAVFFHKMRYDPNIKLDQSDMQIMRLIAADARLSFTEIGQKVNLSRNSVKTRIKSLEKKGLILGYRLSFHPSEFGKKSYLLMLSINNLKKNREKELIEFAKNEKDIIFAVKHMGKYRITLECEMEDEREFHNLLLNIRDRFNDIIIDFEFFPIFFDHKINYFPVK